jgi:hypothetical protein
VWRDASSPSGRRPCYSRRQRIFNFTGLLDSPLEGKGFQPSVPHHDERCCPLARRFPRRMRHATGACLFLGKPSARRNLAGVGLAGKAMLHTVQSRRETREAGSNASSCSALGGRRDAFIENGNLAGIGLGAPMQGSETRSINRLIFGVVSAGIGTHRRNAG